MKPLPLLLLMLGLALPASADISDSGNLTIGGNGIIAGTMTVQGAAPYSLITSSGIKISSGGVTWPDGTTTYSAAQSGSGLLSSTQTWSGANTYTSTVNISGELQLGDSRASANNSKIVMLAKSVDGATQSAGCAVALLYGKNAGDFEEFASTTTQLTAPAGVLLESCAPGSVCRVQIKGWVTTTSVNGCGGPTGYWTLSSTRCQITSWSSWQGAPGAAGVCGNANGGAGSVTVWLP